MSFNTMRILLGISLMVNIVAVGMFDNWLKLLAGILLFFIGMTWGAMSVSLYIAEIAAEEDSDE